jgi:hypothetical protein
VFAALFVILDTWVAKPDALLEHCFGYVHPKSAQREEQGIHSQGFVFPHTYEGTELLLGRLQRHCKWRMVEFASGRACKLKHPPKDKQNSHRKVVQQQNIQEDKLMVETCS